MIKASCFTGKRRLKYTTRLLLIAATGAIWAICVDYDIHTSDMCLQQVVNGSWTPNNTELKFPGIMTDLVLVDCYLPESPVMQSLYDGNREGTPAAGLMVSVSNNGVHKSKNKLKFISYDSTCMECNISTGCIFKVNRGKNLIRNSSHCLQCAQGNILHKES